MEIDDSVTPESKSKDQENGARSWRGLSMASIRVRRLRRGCNLWRHCIVIKRLLDARIRRNENGIVLLYKETTSRYIYWIYAFTILTRAIDLLATNKVIITRKHCNSLSLIVLKL